MITTPVRKSSGAPSGLSLPGALVLLSLALSACSGGDDICDGPFCPPPPELQVPANLLAGPDNPQSGTRGRPLPDSMSVQVTDSGGRPVSGVSVDFAVSTGGGSLLSSSTAVSDNQGFARVSWKLGNDLGPQSLQARAVDGDGADLIGSPLQLTASAEPPQPAKIVLLTPPSEAAQSGVPFDQQPVLEVLDDADSSIAGVEVVASVTAGGGAVSGPTSAATDGSGHAAFSNLALVGPQGAQTLRFGVTTPGVEVTSLIQLTAGTPASMEGGAPLAYEGTVNSPVSPGPTVLVKDAAGNPVAGVEVSFEPNRNASVSPETAVTNAQGIAQVSWTLGSVANVAYSLTARIESTAIPAVRFSAMARAGNAGRLRVAVQPSSPTASGTAFGTQPVIQLEDQNGNPTPQAGVRVTASVSSGPNGSLENATATTNASGQAAFSGLTVMGLVGNYTLSFSAPSLVGVTSAPFTITAGAPARLAVITAPSTLARSRFALVIQPVVEVQDASGNPIRQAGTQVDASVTAPNTSISGQSVVTDENGRAAFTALTLQGIPGPKDVTFSSPTAPGLQSTKAKVTLVSVENVTVAASHPTSAVVGSTVPGVVSTWTLKDGSLRPVADADFTIRLPSGGRVDAPPFSDEFGTVQVSNWTLGTAAGYQVMEFILPSGRTFRDSILALPGPADDLLQVAGGDAQTGPVNTVLPNPLVGQVVDQYGNGVPNVPVQWATCEGTDVLVVNTDGNGFSSVTQPTGSTPTTGCTQATITAPDDRIEFTYTVTAAASGEQPGGMSATESRRGGPPPVRR